MMRHTFSALLAATVVAAPAFAQTQPAQPAAKPEPQPHVIVQQTREVQRQQQREQEIARERGIILADTKVEFGYDVVSGGIVLGDEVLTPDSSRFWDAATYQPGQAQPSYDKQYVRDWLTSAESGCDRSSDTPPPALPADVVERTRSRYVEAYEKITGKKFS